MDSNKNRNVDTKKTNRDDKQGIVKLEEQVEKVCNFCWVFFISFSKLIFVNFYSRIINESWKSLQLLKSFGNSSSADQKIAQLAKNFIELEKESNRRAAALKTSEKVLEKEQREKEHLQREYNKGVLMRFVLKRTHKNL